MPIAMGRKFFMRAILALIALLLSGGLVAIAQQHSNPWLLTWIGRECCVTNDCCFKVTSRDLQSLPDDKWKVVASGQILPRKGYSPDGLYYRCACDFDHASGKWIVHPTAYTRCVFIPLNSM